MPASTVHRILTRHGLNRLAWMDRPTGEIIRRYERDRPGELTRLAYSEVHPDEKAAPPAPASSAGQQPSSPPPAAPASSAS